MTTKHPDDLLTSAQACEILGIDRSTLSRWVTAGRIKPAWSLPGMTGVRLFRPRDVHKLRDQEKPVPASGDTAPTPGT